MLSTVRRDLVGQGMRRDLSTTELCSVFCVILSLHFDDCRVEFISDTLLDGDTQTPLAGIVGLVLVFAPHLPLHVNHFNLRMPVKLLRHCLREQSPHRRGAQCRLVAVAYFQCGDCGKNFLMP